RCLSDWSSDVCSSDLRDAIATQGLTDYPTWVRRYDTLSAADVEAIRAHVAALPERPRVSVIVEGEDEQTRRSLEAQLYAPHEVEIGRASCREGGEGRV